MNNKPAQIKKIEADIFRAHSSLLKDLNETLLSGFLKHQNDTAVKRSHLFNDRYENIYLNEQQLPELKLFRQEACRHASIIIGNDNIKAGFWFNYMPPGAITTMHTHDDDDEQLSGVYYVTVPENSGNLIIYNDLLTTTENNTAQKVVEIEPKAGDFIFFKPDARHEVSKNNSKQHRLSIGINFGMDQ